MNALRIILGIALPMAISGCGLARVYNKIKLGEPMPEDLGLVEEELNRWDLERNSPGDIRRFGMMEYYVWHTLLTTSIQSVTVITDPDKVVLARMYDRKTIGGFFLIYSVSAVRTCDIIVPEKALADLDGSSLSDGLRDFEPVRDHPIRQRAQKAMHYTAPLLVEYLMYVRIQEVGVDTDSIPLAEALKPGYRKTFFPKIGGWITISNIGDNRLRIEKHVHFTTDPLCLMMLPAVLLERSFDNSNDSDEEPEQSQGGIE